jgi:hypothetical protein
MDVAYRVFVLDLDVRSQIGQAHYPVMILIEKCLEMGATKDSIITPGSGESRLIMAWLQIRQAAVPGIFTRTLEISSTLHKERAPVFPVAALLPNRAQQKKPGISRAFGRMARS